MSVSANNEIIIHGTTGNGRVFRPSDWAERLCGILSSFDKDNRLSYHEWVFPVVLDKIRCVSIDGKLQEINPAMFRFLMDFAADNDLRVMNKNEVVYTDEQVVAAKKHEKNEEPAPVKSAAQSAKIGKVREIAAEETATAFAALSFLRPTLDDIHRFVEQVNTVQRQQGYRLLGIFEEGKNNAVAVCGFREETNLSSGRHLHIDDLITIPQCRNRGYAVYLLQEVQRIAKEQGIGEIHADCNVEGDRANIHRLCFQHGFFIRAHHFVCKTDNK